jgi:hypothetical protein
MQQPGILQPAEADSPSIGRRRFTEQLRRSSRQTRDRKAEAAGEDGIETASAAKETRECERRSRARKTGGGEDETSGRGVTEGSQVAHIHLHQHCTVIESPCTQCLRHGDPTHARKRLTIPIATDPSASVLFHTEVEPPYLPEPSALHPVTGDAAAQLRQAAAKPLVNGLSSLRCLRQRRGGKGGRRTHSTPPCWQPVHSVAWRPRASSETASTSLCAQIVNLWEPIVRR